MAGTTIQALAALRSLALDRQEPIDLIESEGDWARHEVMRASRSWSRQSTGIGDAILAEPPENVGDALSVLLIASQVLEEELIMGDQAPAQGSGARACEQLRVALTNCIVALAKTFPPKTELERRDVAVAGKQQEWWLPKAPAPTAADSQP